MSDDLTQCCRWCLGEMPAGRRKFCSAKCGKRHHSRAPHGDADGYGAVLASRRCIECGVAVPKPENQRASRRKLCDDCTRAVWREKARRRYERKRCNGKVGYEREEIFERDGWTCQLCGEQVDRGARFPDPAMASIDHVVPVAEGGADTPENVQTAHLGCNWSRGGRQSQEQFGPASNRWRASFDGAA